MKKVSIDLAEGGPDESPVSLKDAPNVYYPSLHISSDEEIDLPDEGQMLVTFRKTRTEESKSDRGERYCCTLEIQSIDGVGESKVGKKSPKPDEVFDEAMKKYMDEKMAESEAE